VPDPAVIKKHLELFSSNLENLKRHKGITVEDIQKDMDLLWILERGLYLLIQNLFDMLAHIAAADFNEKWDYYTDIGDILERREIISNTENELLKRMAGFRNRLSHEYLSLELNILEDVVNNRLSDFSNFMVIIKNYCRI
jgi:uncharacterized protein YutE (UPF0331/DUF86 family)